MNDRPGKTVVLRALSSLIAFWALTGLAAVFVVDAAVRGRWDVALRTVGVVLFVLWAAWLFLVRMSVRLDAGALTARNLLRWVRVPWARVVDIERRAQLTVELDDGRRIECWGSPFAPRRGVRGPTSGGQAMPTVTAATNPFGPALGGASGLRGGGTARDAGLEAARSMWLSASAADGPVTRGWDIPALVAGAVCLVCAVVAIFV
jgi:hypothetical protein